PIPAKLQTSSLVYSISISSSVLCHSIISCQKSIRAIIIVEIHKLPDEFETLPHVVVYENSG
ncbi:hypothetical protein L9F63_005378, partial [Diploptera punctata]